ncbi:hypothetical protein CHUAL_004692 [Chamberlinius hualienensis]
MASHGHHHHSNAYSNKKRTRRPNFLPSEVEKLVSALEQRRELVTGELGGVYKSQADLRKGWDEVTRAVNSIGRSMRTVAEIREKWMHLKCRTKKKATCVGQKSVSGGSGGTNNGAEGLVDGAGGEGRSRDPQLGGLVTPLEERILNLMWGCSVFDLPSGVGGHLNSPTHEQMPESSNLSASCTSEPPSFLKTEIIEEDSNNEFSPTFRERCSSNCNSQSWICSSQAVLQQILELQAHILDTWIGVKNSMEANNKIQKGILYLKYLKLQMLAKQNNHSLTIPSELEGLLNQTSD